MGDSIKFQPKVAWGDFFITFVNYFRALFGKSIETKKYNEAKIKYKKTIENFQKCIKKEIENFKVNQLKEYEEILKKSDQQVWKKIKQYKQEKKEETKKEAVREKTELTKLQAYEYYKNQGAKS